MAIDGGAVDKWLDGVGKVSREPGWRRQSQALIWVDLGNSWTTDAMRSGNADKVAATYGRRAQGVAQRWVYAICASAGVFRLGMHDHREGDNQSRHDDRLCGNAPRTSSSSMNSG